MEYAMCMHVCVYVWRIHNIQMYYMKSFEINNKLKKIKKKEKQKRKRENK
jgi:hypothetical protein